MTTTDDETIAAAMVAAVEAHMKRDNTVFVCLGMNTAKVLVAAIRRREVQICTLSLPPARDGYYEDGWDESTVEDACDAAGITLQVEKRTY